MKLLFPQWMLGALILTLPLGAAGQTSARQFNKILDKQDKGDLEGAIAGYDRLLRINPKDADAYLNRGVAKYDNGDLDGAIVDYNRSLALRPGDADGYNNRGLAKYDGGDVDGAISDYNRALELSPKRADTYYSRGSAKYNQKDFLGAIADFNSSLELDPTDPDTHAMRGLARQDSGDVDGAIADYTRTLDLNPKEVSAYSNRGNSHAIKRDWAGALSDYRAACKLDKEELGRLRLSIWLVRTHQGERDAADKELVKFIGKRKKDEFEEWQAKVCGHLLGEVDEEALFAATKSEDADTEAGQLCEAWFYSGMKKLLTGDKAAAAKHFEKAIATQQTIYPAYDFAKAELKALAP